MFSESVEQKGGEGAVDKLIYHLELVEEENPTNQISHVEA
jgi:hypothetical protein